LIRAVLQDRYRVDSELDQGDTGAVYAAHDTLLERDVALKVLGKTGLGSEGRARLLNEARAAAKLDHPNIESFCELIPEEETNGHDYS
jgi:serine/threonine protein kinase